MMFKNILFNLLPLPCLLALLVTSVGPLHAALVIKEQAHELDMSQVLRWPLRAGDSLVFRQCGDCPTETLKLTADSVIATGLDGSVTTLKELLRARAKMRRNEPHVIAVFYFPDSREISRLILQTDV